MEWRETTTHYHKLVVIRHERSRPRGGTEYFLTALPNEYEARREARKKIYSIDPNANFI